MARQLNRLTAIAVTRAKKPGYYSDGGGLFLRIGPTGAKSWSFRYKVAGKTHEMGLGPTHTIKLVEARQRAQHARKQRLDGIDPIAARRATRARQEAAAAKAMTFRQAAERYFAAHRAGWVPDHAKIWERSLSIHAHPIIGHIAVADVELAHIMSVLEPMWLRKTHTANAVRSRIEAVLGWATTHGYRSGDNPARWRGHLENLLPKQSKVRPIVPFAALPYADINDFMARLRQQPSISARALEFAILTGTRTGEVLGTEWSEIDLSDRLWIIPAKRMKARREHRVPLSDPAVELIDALPRGGEHVFQGATGSVLEGTALLMVMRRMGKRGTTVHGFRSTFSTWAAERTNYSFEVREMALAHLVGNQVERAYQRSDLFERRRRLMQDWAAFCSTPAASGEVVTLRQS